MIHSASLASPAIFQPKEADGQTKCVKIMITTDRYSESTKKTNI